MGDERFSALARDPRYRLPSRKEARTTVDSRFGRLFKDADFQRKASVDRYGRKVRPEHGRKELEKRFKLNDASRVADSSSEDEEVSSKATRHSDRDPARDGGFSTSESEEDSSEDEESEGEAALADDTAGREQAEEIPMGEVSRRIAAVNLDWDNMRAADILAVASSFAPTGGKVEQVVVYPSEFGKERLEQEELEGPPRAIFASKRRDDGLGLDGEEESDDEAESDDEDEDIKKRLLQEQASEGAEFDTANLRQYQLERLRYYYALIICDDKATAKALYDSMDGREYLSSANFFDLRFVPDETSFDDDRPRDSCSALPPGYKPNEFRTEALTHSKVHLTWDDDDTTRKEVQRRAFSRAEIDENDLQAYIGSGSSGSEGEAEEKRGEKDTKTKGADRLKLRAALGLGDRSKRDSKSKAPVGDLQITFSSGLQDSTKSGKANGVFENEPQDEESTRDRYIRKERDRKQKRKEKSKSGVSGETAESEVKPGHGKTSEDQDLGFDDPFFAGAAKSDNGKAPSTKKSRSDRKEKPSAADEEKATKQRAELGLLMAEDDRNGIQHFDIREIERAERDAKRKGKKGRKSGRKGDKGGTSTTTVDNFEVKADDPRFKALYESHEYAIDPTNPRFQRTKGMSALLEEGRKKRKRSDMDGRD